MGSQEELAARPRVPALLRRIAAYSSLGPDSELGPGPVSDPINGPIRGGGAAL